MIKPVYVCKQCGNRFKDEGSFKGHIDSCNNRTEMALMWNAGFTLAEVNERFGKIKSIPEHIKDITKDTILTYKRDDFELNNVQVTRLAMTGYYISVNGKEQSHNNIYSSLKYLSKKICN